jgi:(heptosyl)LPS beta-1,4-glucosyltransferase
MRSPAPPITVTIITLNEADRIGAALASVDWADERLVIDSGSTDSTVGVAAAAGARVERREWRGYGRQKNLAAALARNDTILSIDADERISTRLAASIQALTRLDGRSFRFRRLTRVGGRPIGRWPWAGEWKARLYDRRASSFSADRVHESLLGPRPSPLRGVMLHDSYRDWAELAERQADYARLWAEQARERGRSMPAAALALRPAAAFARELLLRGTVVAGADGLRWARFAARATRLKYEALQELERE